MCKKCVLLTFSMVLLGMVLTEVVRAQDPSLVGWWKFDEGAGNTAQDSSGKAHHGTLQGAPQWVAGRFDGALAFGGSDYVEIAYAADLALNEFTVCAWVNLATEPGVFGVHGTRVGGEYTFDFKVQTTYIHGDIGTGSAWLNTVLDIAATDTGTKGQGGDLEVGTWYMIAYVIDNAKQQVRLYLDGDLKKTISISGKPLLMQTGESMHIGDTGYPAEGMNGLIDDVRIYSRALSSAEIKAMVPPKVKARKPTPADGAVGVMMGLFQWTPGETALFEDVYLGTTPDLTAADRKSHQSSMLKMYFQMMPPLVPGQTYYWRVDAVDATGTVLTGDVWSFTMTPVNAWNPAPVDSAKYQSVDADLTWTAGQNAFKHEVYFSANRDDVANAAAGASKGSLIATTLELPPLTLETTYYWRVDEIDATGNKKTGDVWSFTTTIPGLGFAKRELWMNSNAGTTIADIYADARYPGSPTDVNDKMPNFESPADIADNYIGKLSAWLHVPVAGDYTFWVAADDQAQLFLGPDPDSAVVIASVTTWTSAREWGKEGSQKSKPITLEAGRYYLMAHWKEGGGGDSGSAAWQGPGIPTRELIAGSYLKPFEALWAYGPRPRNNDVNTPQILELKWTAGTRATAHQIYFSDDANAVADGTASRGQQALEDTSFDPGALEFGKTYYWRVDEVSTTDPDSPWTGTVWSFTTANFIVVDDFESYVDDVEGRIFQSWIDGWGFTEPAPGNPGNGTNSTVGYTNPPFAETSIVHGGRQAMPLDYNNIIQPYYSETDRTWTTAQNWTLNGMDTLSLWFRGNPVNLVDKGNGAFTVSASGHDIWDNADDFRLVYKRIGGDGSITAKVESIGNTNAYAKAGVMIRATLEAGSMYALVAVSPSNGTTFEYRAFADDAAASGAAWSGSAIKAPYWVRLTRTGNLFNAETSPDGKTWTTSGTAQTIQMGTNIYIGLCVTSHDTAATTTAEFSGAVTTGGVTGAWQQVWIGDDPDRTNATAQMYVAIQDSAGKVAVVNHPDLNAVLTTTWTEWQIPLTQFTGVNTKAIKKMYIGVGDRKAPKADGAGKLYFDDIGIVKPATGN